MSEISPDPQVMARRLRDALAGQGIEISDSLAQEIVAAQVAPPGQGAPADHGVPHAALHGVPADALLFHETCPILRIFDEAKAMEFYTGYLGFALDWEHRFAPGLPLYAQVSRAGLILHLSGHHGDATPGSTVFVRMTGIRAFHAELRARRYPLAPGLEKADWGMEFEVPDPFGNRLRFCE